VLQKLEVEDEDKMPYGLGTYGSKRGRPKKKNKNGSPKRRKAKRKR